MRGDASPLRSGRGTEGAFYRVPVDGRDTEAVVALCVRRVARYVVGLYLFGPPFERDPSPGRLARLRPEEAFWNGLNADGSIRNGEWSEIGRLPDWPSVRDRWALGWVRGIRGLGGHRTALRHGEGPGRPMERACTEEEWDMLPPATMGTMGAPETKSRHHWYGRSSIPRRGEVWDDGAPIRHDAAFWEEGD